MYLFAAALLAGCMPRDAVEARRKARYAGWNLGPAAVEWEQVLTLAFDDPSDMALFRVVEGKWEIGGGALRAIGGDRNRAVLLAPCGPDPVRIEFEATNHASRGLIGDITVLIGATPDAGFFTAGYTVNTGSYWNTCTTVYRKGKAIANTAWSPVRSGRRNRVAIEFVRGRIRYEMNGEILLETWNPEPLTFGPDRWIGVRTWATRREVDNVTVFRGKTPVIR